MGTDAQHGELVWRDGGYVRVDNRPEPVELTVAEREKILDQCQAEVEQAALERGATPDDAREGARRLRGQFRVKAGPVGVGVEAYAAGGWGILRAEDAARRMGHGIVKEARKEEEKAVPPPTDAELKARIRAEQGASWLNNL